MYPKKIVIEPTTRCNFKCEMCVKQSRGCRIKEGDMGLSVFQSVTPLLPHANTIIFTGIGEPLLYEGLETCLSTARDQMPEKSTRGFQTNGKLLTQSRAERYFEIPMDLAVSKGLRRGTRRGQLPIWKGIKRLSKEEHAVFQKRALVLAKELRTTRVHLDALLWVQER
jgi:organic radical activating enzyme